MKQFLYLDTDIINSIIAQTEKGLVDKISNEKNGEEETERILNHMMLEQAITIYIHIMDWYTAVQVN